MEKLNVKLAVANTFKKARDLNLQSKKVKKESIKKPEKTKTIELSLFDNFD